MNALAMQNPRHKCDLETKMIQSLTRKQYLTVIIITRVIMYIIVNYIPCTDI